MFVIDYDNVATVVLSFSLTTNNRLSCDLHNYIICYI